MSESLDEAGIVRGLRNGDREAWDSLCKLYSERVCRYVARLVGNDAEAVTDVFQETMLAVAKNGREIREDTRLWSWLSTVSHNQAALYWRRVYRNRSDTLVAGTLSDGSANDPVETLSRTETRHSIRAVLAQMNSEHVALLSAKYIHEMTISEIVAMTGGTTESIRSKLARARKDFRERIERLASGSGDSLTWNDASSDEGAS